LYCSQNIIKITKSKAIRILWYI